MVLMGDCEREKAMPKIFLLALLMTVTPLWAAMPDHASWDALLARHVDVRDSGSITTVDYAGFATDRALLQQYLQDLEAVERRAFDNWPEAEQLAFLINAYNAWTIELILGEWPDLKSIKDLGSLFRSPWSRSFIPLLGKTRSLDDIEHKLIRGSDRYRDPRIHFAVNCASIGCPALRAEAYRGPELEAQLAEQTSLFLRDRSRNRMADDTLQLSSIFKWYREDFEKQWKGYGRLEEFLLQHADALDLSPADRVRLQAGTLDIDFLSYDWKLNATGR